MTQIVQFKRLNPRAIVPIKATEQAAGFDLFSAGADTCHTKPYITVSTGLSVALPEDHVMLVFGRSGYASKHGLSLINKVGVIDADYRGEILLLFNVPPTTGGLEALQTGNRVAQAIILPIPQITWEEVDTLPATTRGAGGFGSTGTR